MNAFRKIKIEGKSQSFLQYSLLIGHSMTMHAHFCAL